MATLDDFVSFLQGASNAEASTLSAPVDEVNGLLGKSEKPASKKPDAGLMADPKSFMGYPVRPKLYPGEDTYFKGNPHVAGMAAEDGSVVLNPYSPLAKSEKDAVALNEAYRLHMRDMQYKPVGKLNQNQVEFFRGTEYERDPGSAYQSVLARILSGDPSAKADQDQVREADSLREQILRRIGGGM